MLLIASGELLEQERVEATDHLESCSECRNRLEQNSAILDEIREVERNTDCQRFSARLLSLHERQSAGLTQRFYRPVITGAAAVAAALIVVLIWNTGVPPVSAAELVDRAVREQAERPSSVFITIRDNHGVCRLTDPSCQRIRSALATAHWDVEHPLSAASFQHWRAALKNRADRVTENSSSFSLRTSTKEGILHVATLEVRREDFRPVAARLEFEGSDPFEITEETPATTPEKTIGVARAKAARSSAFPEAAAEEVAPGIRPSIDPLDNAEIRVRRALHGVKADLGYESQVQRSSNDLDVFSLVRDDVRRAQLVAALGGISEARIRIKTYAELESGDDARFTHSETGTLSPLAEQWLKVKFPDLDERSKFVNQITWLSTALLGEATALEDLKHSRVADRLGEVRRDHEERIASLIETLRYELEPFAPGLPQRLSLTLDQVRTVESCLTRLFLSSRPDAGSLADETVRLRAVFEVSP